MASDAQALLLQVSADTSKAEKRLKAFEDKLRGVGKTVDKISNDNQRGLDKLFGKPGQAFDKIFDSTRFKILDSGAARVGLFGSSLEKLGVVGLTTAAAIGAVAFAFDQADKALAFTDELEDTAKNLHKTTDELQEYRYAIRAAGGEEKGADEALESFNTTLGKASAGLPKALRGFKELFGKTFSAEDAKRLEDSGNALETVVGKISGLGSNAQKDAIVDQLGLTGIKQLAEGGVEQMKRLREEAHTTGNVFDAALIRRASGLHDEIETINRRISIDMKSAFVSLGPVLVDLKLALADVLEGVLKIIDGFKKMPDRSDFTLKARLGEIDAAKNGPDFMGKSPFETASGTAKRNKALDAEAAQIQHELELRRQGAAANSAWEAKQRRLDAQGNSLVDLSGQKDAAAAAKKAAEQLKHFDAELAKAAEAILSANDDELHTLAQRQDIAIQRLRAEDAARLQAIDDEVATGAITKAQGERLKVAQDDVLIAKANQLIAQQQKAQRELQLKREQDMANAMAGYLDAQLGLTSSAAERAALEAQILTAQRSIARKVLAESLNDPNVTPFQRAFTLGIFDRTTGALEGAQAAKGRAAIAGDQLEVSQATLQSQIDAAQLADQLAETAKDRRDAELKLLDLQYQAQRAQLDYVIATSQSVADIKKARIDRAALDANHASQQQVVRNSTRGPLEQLGASLPTDASKMNEALQNVAAHGLQSLEDGLVSVIGHTKKLGDVFREVAASIIADLARIAIQRAIIAPLENAISLGLSSLPGAASRIFGGARASGGPVDFGSAYMVGEKGPELFVPRVSGSIIPHGSVKAAAMAGGSRVTVIQPIQQDFRGAVMTTDLLRQMQAMAQRSATVGAQAGASIALRGMPGHLAAYQQQAGG